MATMLLVGADARRTCGAEPQPTLASPPPTIESAVSEAPPAPRYHFFRFDDDFSSARDGTSSGDFFDPIKYMPLNENGDISLSAGGELREWYNYYNKPFFGLPGQLSTDDFLLHRLTLFADLHVGSSFRVFGELGNYLEAGKESPLYVFDDDKLDLQQAFADVTFGDEATFKLTVRGGRQEMGYGSYRLVQARDAGNVRLNYDGIRLIADMPGITVSGFYVLPVNDKRGYFDNDEVNGQKFWGVYSTFDLNDAKTSGIDAYYLGFTRENATYGQSTAKQTVHTVGTRLFGAPKDGYGLDYDLEATGQFGTFGDRDIEAFMIGTNVGYTFEATWKPRIGLKVDCASGGGPGSSTLQTFYPIYPSITAYSQAQYFTPANLFDVHPCFSMKPISALTLTFDADVCFRYNTNDAVYTPRGGLVAGSASTQRYVGTTVGMQADYIVDRHSTVSAYYVHFLAGDVVKDALGRDSDYFALLWTFKF